MVDFYAEEYDERTEFKIIPLIEDEGSSHQVYGLYTSQKRARPCDCFVEASPWPSAFPVADKSAIGADGCVALRLPQRPQIEAVLKRLSSHPPTDEKSAERVFEYMQQRAEELNDEHWASLSEAPIVPVRGGTVGEAGGTQHAPPATLFFGSAATRKKYGAILDYCTLTPSSPGGTFLARCGVSDAPSPRALASASRAIVHGRSRR